jgi:transposase
MDNLSVHSCKNIIKIMKKNKLKVLYSVPYESFFNPIELAFRFIKNITYKKIYLNLRNLKNAVIEILASKNLGKSLFKNFVETLNKYMIFIEENNLIKLEE